MTDIDYGRICNKWYVVKGVLTVKCLSVTGAKVNRNKIKQIILK